MNTTTMPSSRPKHLVVRLDGTRVKAACSRCLTRTDMPDKGVGPRVVARFLAAHQHESEAA